MPARVAVVLVALFSLVAASTASARYFGRHKVQYERSDFKRLTTEHFDIYFYPEEEAAVRLAARMAERWYARLSKLLNHQLNGRQPRILYAAHPHFQQTNILSGEIGEGKGGLRRCPCGSSRAWRSTSRSRRGWVWQFGLTPGF